MIRQNTIFAELNGFVIYEPGLLKSYLEENNLQGNDVLKYFTETEHGDIITKLGIAIPMIGVIPEYYKFIITYAGEQLYLNPDEIVVKTDGWIFNSEGLINIVGIGYFKDITAINNANSLSFHLKEGWYSAVIAGGKKDDEYIFEIILTKTLVKPDFYGNVAFEYEFE